MLFDEKFGMFPKKKLKFDGEIIIIHDKEVPISDVEAVYFRPFDLVKNEWGSIYFSKDGNDAATELFNDMMIKFTNGQTNKIYDLLDMLDVEVHYPEHFADERSRQRESLRIEKNTVRCPQCQSTTVQFMDNKRKGFSVGKAAAGGLLTGGIGTLAGFAGKKGKKDRWLCNECGYTFERKN